MGDTAQKVKKPSKFSQIKAEFKKVIWPDKATAAKRTIAVVVISVILGVIIAILDFIFKYGIDFLISL
ncbi:preprotein translocase subunit SecE [Catenibacillus scindens]|uniref:Protein translocase subunit SecE n=1 Tax=Catenibacillus scindens TaxID=673271 RepID=A0A7W8H7W8_9FIRM|nr:preprotein translocase subunit SecE [Catenibacillus scindens]MBB5263449.1 preprotein translocase subunit SecE [Catenibacillus scindens]